MPVDGTPSGGPPASFARDSISLIRSGWTSGNLTTRAYMSSLSSWISARSYCEPGGPKRKSRGRSAAGDGGEDRDLVAVVHRCVEPVLEADVLAGDVDIHEAAQVAVLGDALPEAIVLVEDGVERLADGRALDLQLSVAAGCGAELGRDLHGDAHRAE